MGGLGGGATCVGNAADHDAPPWPQEGMVDAGGAARGGPWGGVGMGGWVGGERRRAFFRLPKLESWRAPPRGWGKSLRPAQHLPWPRATHTTDPSRRGCLHALRKICRGLHTCACMQTGLSFAHAPRPASPSHTHARQHTVNRIRVRVPPSIRHHHREASQPHHVLRQQPVGGHTGRRPGLGEDEQDGTYDATPPRPGPPPLALP